MSKFTKAVEENRYVDKTGAVTNFMGGVSFEINPLDTLKLVTASSIFGEPQYYRDGEFAQKGVLDGMYKVHKELTDMAILSADKYGGMKTSDLCEKVIDEALSYDFEATINWAKTLRQEYNMRLNPQVIMVRAAIHPDRSKFTNEHPGAFSRANKEVMQRADDVTSQLTYYLYKAGSKQGVPGILKKSWAAKVESLSRYELYKYRNHGIGLIDTVRICHAKGSNIDELMKTGTIQMKEENKTWETLRADGKPWTDILDTLGRLPHMAMLRNLRGIFTEIDDISKTKELMAELINGVEKGKQFPFRYMSAFNAIQKGEEVHNKTLIKDALEGCLDKACDNLPHLSGNNAFLSDNSGSAWGNFTSEYGSVTVAEIDNLSSVIGAANSDVGTVIKFGDDMKKFEISKRQGILEQAQNISRDQYGDVGGSTENGVWLFFKEAIDNEIHYDNIFIYSDMQAGHGGLYGTHDCAKEYTKRGFSTGRGEYISVAKLIDAYRSKVNPKVNVFCIQTAGYNNVLVPENGYRTSIMYGWTGKELVYADMINHFWDEKDKQKEMAKSQTQEENKEEELDLDL